ncbi:MAG: hypothetical protein IKE18_06500 [Oscillospiraceae bacterium]|nr:hypothetical protein [Oscillospiraceae bacterium]
MTITVCSQAKALRLAAETQVNTAVISITSTDENDVEFPENPHVQEILRLRFNDLTEEYDEEGIPYGRPLPEREDLSGLKEFAAGLSCDNLIVHCWEGVSRSGAVAKAIYEFRGKTDEIRTDRELSPNPLVYEFAREELGIR